MLLSRSFRRKVLATLLGSLTLSLLYEATAIDSLAVPGARVGAVAAGPRVTFLATAYCKGETTASGFAVRAGMAAADPRFLPQGSVIRIDGAPDKHEGIYTVLDTGPKIRGRRLDLYMWSCYEALDFGSRKVSVTVIRRGWKPNQNDDETPDS